MITFIPASVTLPKVQCTGGAAVLLKATVAPERIRRIKPLGYELYTESVSVAVR